MNVHKKLRLAVKYYQTGNFRQAENIYKEILESQPDNFDALYFLGVILQQKKEYDSAISYYKKALHLNPRKADAYYNLGLIFQDQAEFDEAIESYQQAIKLNPDFADAYYNLGLIFQDQAEADSAIANYRIFLQFNSKDADAYLNLGHAYQMKGQLEEAITCFQKAMQINTDLPDAYYNLGNAYKEKGQPEVAIPYYQKAIQRAPDFVDAHWNMALALLLSGDFNQGWKKYEWRWKLENRHLPVFAQPLWNGSSIDGLTILIHGEQGFGDIIQFVRYVPLVAERGAKVLLRCGGELVSLLQNIRGIDKVLSYSEQPSDFDTYCPIATLPLLFGTTLDTIPAKIPYVGVSPSIIEKWEHRIQKDNSTLRIGLVWSGNPKNIILKNKSFPLETFMPLGELHKIAFYSLQKGNASEQAKNPPKGITLLDYTDEINDFSDTAALIENLDLVISVDTAVAHLTGALGKPIWTLLPFSPAWRWLLHRDDSPWYPTMRLFRQPSPGDWESVIEHVRGELLKLIGNN
jgi:tetratricopeptide (TPR) repeat protein